MISNSFSLDLSRIYRFIKKLIQYTTHVDLKLIEDN